MIKNKNILNKKIILVTGGAGFIGSHIVDAYLKEGYRVIVIDNLSTGKKENLNSKAKFYKTDIRNLSAIENIFKKEKPNIVNHCAAIAEVIKSVKNPLPTLGVNILGTINLLQALGKYGAENKKKFLFASTGGAIYGNPVKIPANEKTETLPVSPYGLSKFLAEKSIEFYSRFYNFNYLILRYPNVYGPRQNPKGEAGVVAIFSHLMRNNKRPVIYGNGNKTRDYVYIDDIVRANILGLWRGRNEILNLGWGKGIKDQKIFDSLAKELNFFKKPIYTLVRPGEVYRIALSPKLAKKILNWRPKIILAEGIKKYISSLE